MIDAYGEGLVDKSEFEPRITSAKQQLSQLQQQLHSRIDQQQRVKELRLVIDNLETFSRQVTASLDEADWPERREIIRMLVKRVEVENEQVKIVYRVDLRPFDQSPERGVLHYCWRSVGSILRNILDQEPLEARPKGRSAEAVIRELLPQAEAKGKSGEVAQYLVAAKLQLRLKKEIPVVGYNKGDRKSRSDLKARTGEFEVANATIEVAIGLPDEKHVSQIATALEDTDC